MRGGQWTRLVVGYMVQTPDFNLLDPCIDDPQEGVNRFGGGAKADGPQLGEGQLQLLPQACGPPLSCKGHAHARGPSCQYG